MSIARIGSLTALVLVLLLVAANASVVAAQDAAPPPPAFQALQREPSMPLQGPDGLWIMPAGSGAASSRPPGMAGTGGPDDFGYTWNDSVPLNWINASNGSETGIDNNVDHAGPISIGFPFKFYENIYSQLYVSRFSFLAFDDYGIDDPQSQIPSPERPDDVIAPHWAPAERLNGYVRYRRGGVAPNRWFVVEWNRLVSDCCFGDPAEEYTFEAVLHENGDIVFQYATMTVNGDFACQASGIEDSTGSDGLAVTPFCRQIPGQHAARIFRPPPAARVNVFPRHQGAFVHAGEEASFNIAIRNTGELGADTYDLFRSSPWPLGLFRADGVTPLTDSDGDGALDTGPAPQGGATTIVAKVLTPANVSAGDYNAANLTVRSSLNPGQQQQVELRTTVPSIFVQAHRDDSEGAMSLMLVRPEARQETEGTGDHYAGSNLAVAEQPDGQFIYAWTRSRCLNTCAVRVSEIETALLDPFGEVVRPASRLVDLSGATVDTYDYPAIAVAPNGRIGLLWHRYLLNRSTGQFNTNIYFAVMTAAGDLIHGPTNLTQNNIWGTPGSLNVPTLNSPRISATGDNRFVLAWHRWHQESGGAVEDIWYGVRQSNGVMVKPATRLTDAGYSDGYAEPALASVRGDRMLLAYGRYGSSADLHFVVLDSAGNVIRPASSLSNDGSISYEYQPDAVELSDGRILIAWSAGRYPVYGTRFALLDAAFNRISGPTTLPNPAALTGDFYVSVAADGAGRGILTWMDSGFNRLRNLYYALVASNGDIMTPAAIFRTSQAAPPDLFTSFEGDGNTSYRWTPPAGVDTLLTLGESTYSGTLNGGVELNVITSGRGDQTATGVVLTATLDPRLVYHSDTSGVTPSVSGTTVTWSLPDIRLLDRREFRLHLGIAGAALGDLLPLQMALTSTEPDLNPADNTVVAQVRVDRPLYLPLMMRGP